MITRLKNILHDLQLSMSFPPCDLLDQQIDNFFKRVQALDPDIAVLDENKSDDGHIRHRRILFHSPEKGVSVDVAVIQISHPEISIAPLFIIDADFGDEG